MSQTVALSASGLAEALKSQVKPGVSGNVEILRTRFDENTLWPRPGPRPKPGEYTELRKGGVTWISDHANEVEEQMPFLEALKRAPRNSPILILGLGLGIVLDAALRMEHKGPFDVVEIDGDVLALVQPHFEEWARMAEAEVRFHLADAYTWRGVEAGRWSMGWQDILPTIEETNLPLIEALERRYAPRCLWYDSWSRREAEWLRSEREAGRVVPGVPIR